MRTKIENPYAYFQERQNQIYKAFELMAVYKTVYQIEKEISDAQNCLSAACDFYENQGKSNKMTKHDYNYIKRLVEDGQPVVLSKKMKRAIKMKDDLEFFDKAMVEDLKAAGFKESEIKLMTE